MKFLFLALFLTGCGYVRQQTGFQPDYDYNTYNVAPDFIEYVNLFKIEHDKYSKVVVEMKPLIVEFGPLDERTLGECTMYTYAAPKIVIDPAKWKDQPDCWRELLMFHELGHCKLHRDHVEGTLDSGIHISVMNPTDIGCAEYVPNRDYYLNELFTTRGTMKGFSIK